jgi:cardiolipin synthase
MVEVTGPVVSSLETEFDREWAHEGPLGDLGYLARVLATVQQPAPATFAGPWVPVRLLPTKTGWKPFATAVLGSLRQAQRYVYVENPYLFDKRVIIALVKARARGVDVRVVLPCVNDFKAGGRSNLVIANYLMERGVRVYFYPSMTHVKALLVDGWACLGSSNLNHLSLRVNHEENIATSDPGFAAQLRKDLFEEDFARSYELKEPISVDWVDFLADLALEGF